MPDLSYEAYLAQQQSGPDDPPPSGPLDLSYEAYLSSRKPKRTLGQRVQRMGRYFLDAGAASTEPLFKYGSKFLDMVIPGGERQTMSGLVTDAKPMGPIERWAQQQIDEFRASREAYGAPETLPEKLSGLAGGFAGYGSQAMLTGAGTGAVLSKLAPAGSRLAQLGQMASSEGTGLKAILTRQAAGTALTAPFDALQAADPETSVSTMLGREDAGYAERLATELGTSMVAGSGIDALLSGLRRMRPERKTVFGQNPRPAGAMAGPRPGFAQMDATARNLQGQGGLQAEQGLREQELLQEQPSQASQLMDLFEQQKREALAVKAAMEAQQARRAAAEAEREQLRQAMEQAETERMAVLARQEEERLEAERRAKMVYEEPPEEEFVAQSAIRSPDGKLFLGRTHLEAVVAAEKEGIAPEALSAAEDGFVTSTGRFVGREEAAQVAGAAGQVPPDDFLSQGYGVLGSEDLNLPERIESPLPPGPGAEHVREAKLQKFRRKQDQPPTPTTSPTDEELAARGIYRVPESKADEEARGIMAMANADQPREAAEAARVLAEHRRGQLQQAKQAAEPEARVDRRYTPVQDGVDGLRVGSETKNLSSIGASLEGDYAILPGVREVPLGDFGQTDPHKLFYSKDDIERTQALAKEIERSGRIDPLIVVIDKDGPYVLEGGHRLGALHLLKKKSLPAVVVLDEEVASAAKAAEPEVLAKTPARVVDSPEEPLERQVPTFKNYLLKGRVVSVTQGGSPSEKQAQLIEELLQNKNAKVDVDGAGTYKRLTAADRQELQAHLERNSTAVQRDASLLPSQTDLSDEARRAWREHLLGDENLPRDARGLPRLSAKPGDTAMQKWWDSLSFKEKDYLSDYAGRPWAKIPAEGRRRIASHPFFTKNEAGFAAPGLVQSIGAAGTGALVGAAANDDDPLGGALLGAAVGAGALGAGKYLLSKPGSGRQHVAPRTVPPQTAPLQVDKALRGQGAMQGGRATSYERGVNQGTIGKPKDFELVPSVAGLFDPGRELDVALQRVRQNSPIRQEVSLAEQRKIAQKVGVADLLGTERTSLTPPEMHALGDFIRAGEKEMYDLAEQMTKTGDPKLLADLDDKFAAAMRAVAAAAAKLDQAASEHGRGLQLLQHIAKNQSSPVFWQQLVARQFRVNLKGKLLSASFSGSQQALDGLNKLLQQYSIAGPGNKIILSREGQRAVAEYVWKIMAPQGTLDMAADLRRAGLLTNPATHFANVISNFAFGGVEQVTHAMAGAMDRLISGGNIQKRTILATMDRAKTYYSDLLKSIQGKGELKDIMRELDEYAAQGHKRVYYNPNKIKGIVGEKAAEKIMGIAQAYSDGVYKLLSWEDKLFRGAAMLASLEERAQLRAMKEGLKKGTAGYNARVKELSSWATAHIDDKVAAKLDGEVATFTDPNAVAGIVNMAKNRAKDFGKAGELAGFVLDLIAPFVKTPSNIVYRGFQYSPAGLALNGSRMTGLLYKRITGQAVEMAPEEIRQLLLKFSRGTLGTALFGLGLALYAQGKAVGSTPGAAAPRADREQANIPPTSVKIGDTWINAVRTMGPIGMAIIMGAEWGQSLKEEDESPAAAMLLGIAPIAAEQPLLKGTYETAGLVLGGGKGDEGKALTRFTGTTAASFVPAGVAALARATDPVGSRQRETIGDYLKDRIPGMRQELQPRRSPLGDIEESRGVREFLPGRPTQGREDLLSQKQRELHTGTQAVKRLTLASGQRESDELYRARRGLSDSLVRERLQKLTSSPRFQQADPQAQQDMWEKLVSETRARATRQFKRKHRAEYKDLQDQPRSGYKILIPE